MYELANEMVRSQLEKRLRQMEEVHGAELLVDGKRYRRHEPGAVEYHTLSGKVEVSRWTYREVGVRNGPVVVPLELKAGMIRRTTPALAYSIALGYANGPMREYAKQMSAAYRAPPPRATLERMALAMGGSAARDVVAIEAQVRAVEELPEEARTIAISLDRTTVAMAEELPVAAASPPKRRRKKPYQRRPPHPFAVNWRMPYVGTVSLIDRHGAAISTRKYHATPEEGTDEIGARMMADVVRCREERSLPVVVVQDGSPEMWNVLRAALRGAGIEKWTELIDRFHVHQHLSQALELMERDEARRRWTLEHWKRRLDESDRAIYGICRSIEHRRWRLPRLGEKAKALGAHMGYLRGYSSQMKYVSARRRGFPVASGAVEGACKSLVACRAKRSGQRWKQDGLTAVLTLRALDQSERLSPFWKLLAQRFTADVRVA